MGEKESHHNPNSNFVSQDCLQNLFSSALDKTFNCNDLAEKFEENLSTWKHQGEKNPATFWSGIEVEMAKSECFASWHRICFTFQSSTGLFQGVCVNLIPLALQDHCSYHSSKKLANKSGFNLPWPEGKHLQMQSWLNYQLTRCNLYINTGDSWQHRVQTFLTGHHDQQDIPKEELEGHNSDPIQ